MDIDLDGLLVLNFQKINISLIIIILNIIMIKKLSFFLLIKKKNMMTKKMEVTCIIIMIMNIIMIIMVNIILDILNLADRSPLKYMTNVQCIVKILYLQILMEDRKNLL